MILHRINRPLEDMRDRVSGRHSTRNPSLIQSGCLVPVARQHSHAVECDHAIVASVSLLLAACCPATVLPAVVAVGVDPVECMERRRTSPHVNEEVLESSPVIRNGDSASSVVREKPGIRIVASLKYALPDPMLRYSAHTVSSEDSSLQASARRRLSARQMCDSQNGCSPAVAQAFPCGVWTSASPVCHSGESDSRQLSETSSRDILDPQR